MAMPEKMPEHIWAFVGASFQGLWIQCAKPETTPYIRADLVDDLVKALEEARDALWQARLYIEGDETTHGRQFGDGNAVRAGLARIDAALTRIKGDGK